MALGRDRLDTMRCGMEHPDGEPCDHSALYFHSRCHPRYPTWAVYSDGELTIKCAACDQTIAVVAVAEGTTA